MLLELWNHGFLFANPKLQTAATYFSGLLPTITMLLLLVSAGSLWRTSLLWILAPVHLLIAGGLAFALFLLGPQIVFAFLLSPYLNPNTDSGKSAQASGLTIRLLTRDYNDARSNCPQGAQCLIMERPILRGNLIEYKKLIEVSPSVGHFEVIEDGRKFKYIDSHDARNIVRIYDADWNANADKPAEHIGE